MTRVFDIDGVIAGLAGAQLGRVSRTQLLAAGITEGAIRARIRAKRLHQVHRGVYAVGHTGEPPWARQFAALLACGPAAVLSHRSAIELWGFLDEREGPVHVTVPGRSTRRHQGIRIHAARRLDPRDIRRRHDMAVTSPARALLDFAEMATRRELELAYAEASVKRLINRKQIDALIARTPGRKGEKPLRHLLEIEGGPKLTKREAERIMLELIRQARLPEPETNAKVGRWEVDMLWRKRRYALEIDGYEVHGTRAAFERDRLKDAELDAIHGLRSGRVTWRQLTVEPYAVVARLARTLASEPL